MPKIAKKLLNFINAKSKKLKNRPRFIFTKNKEK